MQLCSQYDPVHDRNSFAPSVSCYDEVAPEVFDGLGFSGVQFVAERPLQQMLLVPCLSFDSETDLCDLSNYPDGVAPCEGM
eukprot:1485768-Prorocentrum_lima.AAC.1